MVELLVTNARPVAIARRLSFGKVVPVGCANNRRRSHGRQITKDVVRKLERSTSEIFDCNQVPFGVVEIGDRASQGIYHPHELPLGVVFKLHSVLIPIADLDHPCDPLGVWHRIQHLCSDPVLLRERAVRVLHELRIEADWGLKTFAHYFVSVGTPVAIHPMHAAIGSYEQTPVVVELPVMAQWTIEDDSAAVGSFELPIKPPARYL